jgi:hypothetical protein
MPWPLHYCVLKITLEGVEELVKASSSDHEPEEDFLMLELRVRVRDCQVTLPGEEGGRILANWLRSQVKS